MRRPSGIGDLFLAFVAAFILAKVAHLMFGVPGLVVVTVLFGALLAWYGWTRAWKGTPPERSPDALDRAVLSKRDGIDRMDRVSLIGFVATASRARGHDPVVDENAYFRTPDDPLAPDMSLMVEGAETLLVVFDRDQSIDRMEMPGVGFRKRTWASGPPIAVIARRLGAGERELAESKGWAVWDADELSRMSQTEE